MEENNIVNKPKLTDDPSAPLLYTKRSILLFSVIFSFFFGSILLAINLKAMGVKRSIVILPVAIGFVLNYLLSLLVAYTQNIGFTIVIINGLLGYLLTDIFWKRYIGSETAHRKRSITIPLLIGIGLSLILLFLMASSLMQVLPN